MSFSNAAAALKAKAKAAAEAAAEADKLTVSRTLTQQAAAILGLRRELEQREGAMKALAEDTTLQAIQLL